ncbi:MAG: DUF2911 domain-containing protein [Chitinophagaceae bacterium]
MKSFLIAAVVSVVSLTACGQKVNTQSPIAEVKGSTASGTTIYIRYNQPSVRGRTIGKDLEPLPGKVWRTGADSATVFEINKDVKVEGKSLAAGRYALFTIANGDDWTIIFNKDVHKWGAFSYKESEDVLRVNVKAGKAAATAEKFTITVSNAGKVDLLWGNSDVAFKVE